MTVQETLAEIAQGFSIETIGEEFFHSMTAYLARVLDVDYVFMGELLNQNRLVSSIVFYAHGKESKSTKYPLAGSLCEHVVRSQDFCAFPRDVQRLFPENQALKHYDVDSYVAIPLKASDGKVIGLLYLMDKHPMNNLEESRLLLTIMAKRASLELERQQQERALQAKNQELENLNRQLRQTQKALEASNQGLEEQVARRTAELQVSEEELRQSLQKLTELNQTLTKREAFLNSIITQTSVGIAMTDLSGRFIYANEGYQKMVGWPLDQLQQMTIKDLTHPDDLSNNLALLEQLIQVGKWFEFEKRYVKPDGSTVWVLVNVSLVSYGEGEPHRIMAICQNITQRKQIESALAYSEHQLRLITNALPVLVSYIDAEQRYQFVNNTYEQWFGESLSNIAGRTIEQVVGQEAYAQISSLVEKVLLGEEQHFEREVYYRKAGKRFVEGQYIPHWHNGKVVGFYGLVTDITMHKQAKQELEQAIEEAKLANEQLSSINADLDNFVYMASHDLKAPINNIEGLLRILDKRLNKQGWQNEETENIFKSVNESILRFKQTITGLSQIISVSQLTNLELTPVNIEEVVQDVILDIQPQILESGAYIEYHFGSCPAIMFSRKNLRSIVYNLFSNAIKYRSPERKPEIKMHCQELESYILFSVQDNGLGMSEEGQNQIFSMFKRLHSHVEGTGVGLYLIKKMLESAGGKIEVESLLGQGSTFRIYLKKN